MALDTIEIRSEIRRILESGGKLRSKELAEEVMKKIGSEKTVYREIKKMAESGELQKFEINKGHVEYELVEAAKHIDNFIGPLHNHLLEIDAHFSTFADYLERFQEPLKYQMSLSDLVTEAKNLQKIETRLRIYKSFPAIKKSKYFRYSEKNLEKCWESIVFHILHLSHDYAEKLLREFLINFEPVRIARNVTSYSNKDLEKSPI